MSALSRPPRDITPADFFERWLPERYQALRQTAPSGAQPPDVVVGVTLEGDQGGAWTMRIADGQLAVTSGSPERAAIRIAQSVDDWRAITTGGDGDGSVELMPSGPAAGAGGAGVMMVDPEAQRLLQQLNGSMRFEVPGYRGRTWSLAITFNDAAEPSSTISVDADTYAQMRDRTLPPAQAYFSGKIRIAGDANLAMQIGMALMSRI